MVSSRAINIWSLLRLMFDSLESPIAKTVPTTPFASPVPMVATVRPS